MGSTLIIHNSKGGEYMPMTKFEKQMLRELKGINKELHEINRNLKKGTTVELDGEQVAESINDSLQQSQRVNGY